MNAALRNWSLEIDAEGVATLTIDCAGTSTNTLGRRVRSQELGVLALKPFQLPHQPVVFGIANLRAV